MSVDLNSYMDGIYNLLTSVQGRDGEILNGVDIVREDAADVAAQVDKAIGKTGMMVLIGTPRYDNTRQSQHAGIEKVYAEIAIMELPILWRDIPLTKPTCLNVEKRVRGMLQNYFISGFEPLQVMAGIPLTDKKSQVFSMQVESKFIQQKCNPDGSDPQ